MPAASAAKALGSISALAPAATASAIWPRTKSAAEARTMGPSVVSGSIGLPST